MTDSVHIASPGVDICRQCAEEGRCCCKARPDQARLSFPLSQAEEERLLPFAALLADEGQGGGVSVSEVNAPDFVDALLRLLPQYKRSLPGLFPPKGSHHRLRTLNDGTCVFLGDGGCRLPRNVRPWYCLLFPGWVQGTTVTLLQSETCLVIRRADTVAHALRMQGVSHKELRELFSRMLTDWGLAP